MSTDDVSPVTKKDFDTEPALQRADSLQVLFYDDPDADSLRYTRYFTWLGTSDAAQIKLFVNEINQVYVQEPNLRNCRSEGKLFLLDGETVLKTVYFSTRQDSCRYLYFIKDGTFVYLPLTETAEAWLKKRRGEATGT